MSSSRPQSRDRRTKSAVARLTPPVPEKPKQSHQLGAKEREKRVKSASLNREKNQSSKKVFPRPSSGDKKERYRTIYNKDFEGTYISPVEPRPTSPTRRNNPHPTQQFMVWRVPSREIGMQIRPGSAMGGPIRDDESEFDDFDAVYGHYRMPPPQPSSMEYGAYLREMRQQQQLQQLQQQFQQQQLGVGDRIPSRLSQREDYRDPQLMMGPTPSKAKVRHVGADVLGRTVKGSSQGALSQWLQTATPDEQQAVLKMLRDAEEGQVKQTIGQVMKPGAAKAVNDWMSKADDRERDVAVRLFSSLGSRSGHRQRSLSEPNVRPPSRSTLPLPPENPSLVDQRLTTPTVGGKPWPKSLWHHLPVRDPPPRIYHRGSLFTKANAGASHYTIHPEWPDYQQSTFNADAVH